jgi:hypothetical protein
LISRALISLSGKIGTLEAESAKLEVHIAGLWPQDSVCAKTGGTKAALEDVIEEYFAPEALVKHTLDIYDFLNTKREVYVSCIW